MQRKDVPFGELYDIRAVRVLVEELGADAYIYGSTDVGGELTEDICNLSSLEQLWIRKSNLGGSIPANIGCLTGLENLLLDESGTVKIIDFGFSTIVPPGKKLKIFCGTPSYMAPEIVARKEYSGFCADVWAMGVLLYALLCGSFPFRGQNDRELYRKIVRGVFHIPECVGEGARCILGRLLTTDMARRRRKGMPRPSAEIGRASCRERV